MVWVASIAPDTPEESPTPMFEASPPQLLMYNLDSPDPTSLSVQTSGQLLVYAADSPDTTVQELIVQELMGQLLVYNADSPDMTVLESTTIPPMLLYAPEVSEILNFSPPATTLDPSSTFPGPSSPALLICPDLSSPLPTPDEPQSPALLYYESDDVEVTLCHSPTNSLSQLLASHSSLEPQSYFMHLL